MSRSAIWTDSLPKTASRAVKWCHTLDTASEVLKGRVQPHAQAAHWCLLTFPMLCDMVPDAVPFEGNRASRDVRRGSHRDQEETDKMYHVTCK